MAGSTLQPIPVEDTTTAYAAYRDRLLIKSLGVQSGVVGKEDYLVTAGTGLQVNVNTGNAFVEQTKAIEESGNTFYNGMYEVSNPVSTNPFNTVEVSAVNPQIAQIILRVYDVAELKIGGSSYGRIEWLNGTANAGATKVHAEEGRATEFGAASLPQSTLRLGYVIVPKNATKSSEFELVDFRRYSGPRLTPILHTSSALAKIGEMFISEGTITGQLPAVSQGEEIGFYNVEGVLTLKCKSGNLIDGDFVTSKSEIKLSIKQHLVLRGISNTEWGVIAGEPKREQVYSGLITKTKGEAEAGIIISETRPATVSVYPSEVASGVEIEVAGKVAGICSSSSPSISIRVFPEQKIKANHGLVVSYVLE